MKEQREGVLTMSDKLPPFPVGLSHEHLQRRIPLVERFVSIQGEGYFTGKRAAFIRFAGCNLNCRFADGAVCDTPWQKARERPTIAMLVDWVRQALLPPPPDQRRAKTPWELLLEVDPLVVLTGGEPTCSPLFTMLVLALRVEVGGLILAVETNGTRWQEGLRWCEHVVVSPKDLPDISHPGDKRTYDASLDPRVLTLPPHEYRYVISDPAAVAPPWREVRRGAYLSPALLSDGRGKEAGEGITPAFVPGAVERCLGIIAIDPRWRLSLQTHKWLKVQ